MPVNGRFLSVEERTLRLVDGQAVRTIPLKAARGPVRAAPVPLSAPPGPDWRSLFANGPPTVDPVQAFGAVLLYPDDEREISELSSQPFVADYLRDLFEQEPARWPMVGRARSILIHNFDAVLTTLIIPDRPRAVRVLYHSGAFAQRQAQRLCADALRQRRVEWLASVQFHQAPADSHAVYQHAYDLVYDWPRLGEHAVQDWWTGYADRVASCLTPGGLGCVVGLDRAERAWQRPGIHLLDAIPLAALPTFRMHQTILPRARLKDGLMLFMVVKQ